MKITIDNLNGEQRNELQHLTKELKRSLSPLIIICYGHRTRRSSGSSAFLNVDALKKQSSTFDIFLTIRDDDPSTDIEILQIARQICLNCTGNVLVFRLKEVKNHLEQKNRFFASIFRKGIILYGKPVMQTTFPQPLPSLVPDRVAEQKEMVTLMKTAKENLQTVKNSLLDECPDPISCLCLLNESATCSIRYLAVASCGVDVIGGFEDLLDFSENITFEISNVFPRNTVDEVIMADLLSLRLMDQGFSVSHERLQAIYQRTAKLNRTTKGFVLRKIWSALPAS